MVIDCETEKTKQSQLIKVKQVKCYHHSAQETRTQQSNPDHEKIKHKLKSKKINDREGF